MRNDVQMDAKLNAEYVIKGRVERILEDVRSGYIHMDDLMSLISRPIALFSIADILREQECGDTVTYVINRNINFTNICVGNYKFCAFRRNKDSNDAYLLHIDDILDKVEDAVEKNATEICIQGGLHPDLSIEFYSEMLERIKSSFDVHIHAFSPMEILHISRNSGMNVEDVLRELKASGLDSMPGTAAEILNDSLRAVICPKKMKTDEWIRIIKTAHRLNIPTTATMMYGHIEHIYDRIEHILRIREIQRDTRKFTEFVPLKFMKGNNELGKIVKKNVSMFEDAVVHSLARVILHPYIKNIQASWVKLTPEGARNMLFYGANDLGGTLMEENISRLAGASSGEYMPPEHIENLIKSAGRKPRRRNTLYELL
ncbi:MAG: 5-amino-6-(D-ribitylamino)uracil--L-tyrosine 4-hydroxyphenyl transferase CofH [Canidatus Methanoxibalbensis ujae]|nr:5-amino-6-(D-ribitylamino)uracil--L-tyrosine 4-hydroxyphenyl transferase CofH [Candidatus Methanoxibalbensis ujae]